MAIEISNLPAAACSVDVSAVLASIPGLPRFFGPAPQQFANAGFGLFAATPAPRENSERIYPGIYRMHVHEPFSFSTGQAGVLFAYNPSQLELGYVLYPPGNFATGVDWGTTPGETGCDVIVYELVSGGEGATLVDLDFTLLVIHYPTQQTPH